MSRAARNEEFERRLAIFEKWFAKHERILRAAYEDGEITEMVRQAYFAGFESGRQDGIHDCADHMERLAKLLTKD